VLWAFELFIAFDFLMSKRPIVLCLSSLLALLAAGEWFSRSWLGLGTPPLYVVDDLTEYRLKPDQQIRRFGNRISVNAFSMRSAPLAASRDRSLPRVLIFGDSIVWGGTSLDQSLIATDVLRQSGALEVGNVSAPSWGPGNWLGWARRFGFLQATDVVLVISSHDAADNPSSKAFQGDQNHPLRPPVSAFFEGFQRYLLPRLQGLLPLAPFKPASLAEAEPTSPTDPRVQRGLADLRTLIQLARTSGARVVAVQFADRKEAASGQFQPGNAWIAQLLKAEGVPAVQAGPIFRSCGPIASLYSDGIHPYTAAGQACLARAIEQALQLPES